MVNTCVIFGCHNRADKGQVKRSYHAIPKVIVNQGEQTKTLSTKRREEWIARIGRKDWTPSQYSKVCSDHFVTGKPSALYDVSHPDWSPSLLLKPEKPQKATTEDCTDSMKRYNRMQQRAIKKKEHVIAEALLDLHNLFSDQNMQDENNESQRCPFRLLGKLENPKVLLDHPVDAAVTRKDEGQPEVTVENIRTELKRLRTENIELKTKLNDFKYSPESFEGKEEKVRYLTGLPGFITLMKVFQLLEPFIAESSRSPLSKFEKYILVLMRLRLNLSVQDLAYRFNVSKATVSRTFINVIHVMNERMKGFILWPDREQQCMTMPMEFRKHFGLRVAIIIDCFEIFIERPSNLLARAETWSNYKHHNTVKFLIGVAPQGTVSFLSKAWGGRSSDKKITENCGILNKLLPGDLILADRGFDIAKSVGLMCAEIKIPSFTKGKKQPSPLEVESTRKIAHVRIHVERVIGLVRNKYTILQDTLPIDFLLSSEGQDPLINEIVCVCCALTNLCESVVPFD